MITAYKGSRKNVHIPDSLGGKPVLEIGASTHGLGGFGDHFEVFARKNLTSVRLPSQLLNIGNATFTGNSITSINIPESVSFIGFSAFQDNQLTSINIPGSVWIISYDAFKGNQLSNITLPTVVTHEWGGISIYPGAFANNRLTNLTIPDTITRIGWQSFTANQLTSVQLPNHLREAFRKSDYIDISAAFDPGVTITYRP